MADLLITVRVSNVSRLIKIKENEMDDVNLFIEKVFSAFGLNLESAIEFHFENNLHAPFDTTDLLTLISQYKNSGSFFIELVLAKPFITIKAEAIRNYIKENEKQYLLDEGKDGNILCGKNEKELVNLLYSYLMKFHSNSPPPSEIIEVCKAAIELFPYLRLEPSGNEGIDLLYNAKAKSGYLYHKIKNEKSKAVKPAAEFTEDDLKRFLSECVVTKDQKKLKETLAQTIPMRRQLLKENSKEFQKFFKFYFADPSLVLYDFTISFDTVDVEALRRKWPSIRDKISNVPNTLIDFSSIPTRNAEMTKFLQMLKYFKTGRTQFCNVLKSLIIFSEKSTDDPMNLMNQSNMHPYIIAIMSNDKKQFKSYIDVNNMLFSVPDNFTFVDVMDIFFKIHMIYDIGFNPNIKTMMNFLSVFVYRMNLENIAVTSAMNNLAKIIF